MLALVAIEVDEAKMSSELGILPSDFPALLSEWEDDLTIQLEEELLMSPWMKVKRVICRRLD